MRGTDAMMHQALEATRERAHATTDLMTIVRRVAQRLSSLLETGVTISSGETVLATHGSRTAECGPGMNVNVSYEGQLFNVCIHGFDDPALQRWATTVVELLIEQATMIEHLPHLDQLRDHFVRDILAREIDDETDVRRVGQILGVDLDRPRSVILIDSSATFENPAEASATEHIEQSRRVIAAVVRFFRLPNETICGHIGEGQVAILKASTTQDLERWSEDTSEGEPSSWADLGALKRAVVELSHHLQREFGTSLDISIGRYHPGLAGLRASYEDCRLALELGRTRQPGQVHCLDELGLAAFVAVSDDLTKKSLAGRILQPLQHDPELIPTLRTFFESECSADGAARRLIIHRNTLRYRLDKIAALTGLNPRAFNEAVQLRIAMELTGYHIDAPSRHWEESVTA